MSGKQTQSEIDERIEKMLNKSGFDAEGKELNAETKSKTEHSAKSPNIPPPSIQPKVKEADVPLKKVKVIDGRHIKLEDLPSNFLPYPDRDHIMIRPFSVQELKLIARAIETGRVEYVVQAIDNCIDIDVDELALQDYFYLYYWLRIESYPNTPHYMEWECDEPVKDEDGNPTEHLCGKENVTPLTKTDLNTIYLEDLGFDINTLDPRLDFPRTKLLGSIEAINKLKEVYKQANQLPSNSEYTIDDLVFVNAAKWLKEGSSLREKLEILGNEPDLRLFELASKLDQALTFGVYEYSIVKCMGCGAERRYRVLLDAPRFFPFNE